jgi:prepilin-type N-terminal cleavage/methylation domain-containing protein
MIKNRGVTLIELVIAIIIMIIIAAIAFSSGGETASEAKFSKTYNEVILIHDAIESANVLIEIEKERGEQTPKYSYDYFTVPEEEGIVTKVDTGIQIDNLGNRLSETIKTDLKSKIASGKTYYLISYKYERPLERLGLEKVSREYLVNFPTTDVYLLDGVSKNGVTEYEYKEIMKLNNTLYEK